MSFKKIRKSLKNRSKSVALPSFGKQAHELQDDVEAKMVELNDRQRRSEMIKDNCKEVLDMIAEQDKRRLS